MRRIGRVNKSTLMMLVGTKLMELDEMIAGLTVRDKIPQIEVAIGDNDCVLAIRVMELTTRKGCEFTAGNIT